MKKKKEIVSRRLGEGWKPLCNHKSYCQTDDKSIYIGQDNHIAYPTHRNNDNYFPNGWKAVRENKMKGELCVYTKSGNGDNALCTAGNSHAWRKPAPGQIIACAKLNTGDTP